MLIIFNLLYCLRLKNSNFKNNYSSMKKKNLLIGPEIVIGRSRSKIFSDGSPNRKITPVQSSQQIMDRLPHSQRVPPIGAEQDPLETDQFR